MNIKLIQAEDYENARRICEARNFPFPNSSEIVGALVATDTDLVGVGILRCIYESIIAVDPSKEKATQAAAFKGLIQQGRFYSSLKGVNEWHCFVEDQNVVKTLKSTFGFRECRGTPLIINFGGEHGQVGTETG